MRTKKAMLNMVSSATYQIVSIICGLIVPRLILRAFGSTYNGVVESATQFLSVINILNIGIDGATRVALYKTLAHDDILGTSRIYKSNKQYMRKVAASVILYTVVLMFVYPLISHNSLNYVECSALIGIIGIRTFAEYFFGTSNMTLLKADQTGYISYSLNIVANILNAILTVVLIRANCSIFVVKLGSSIIFLLNPAVLNFYVKKKYELIRNCEPDDTAIKHRGAVVFHSIANLVHDRTDLLILTLFTDAKVISVYTVYYLVVGKIKSILKVFTNGLEAAFGNMWIKNEKELMERNFLTFEYAMFAFTTVVFSCVAILILPFIELYTRGVDDINYLNLNLAILITVAEGTFCIRQPYVTVVQATGSYEETKKGAAVEAGVNMFLSIILVRTMGISGVIIGTLVANLIRTSQYMVFTSKNIFHRNMRQILLRSVWLIGNSAMIIIIAGMTVSKLTGVSGWTGWIIKGISTFTIACVITIITSFTFYRKDFMHLFDKFKAMLTIK